MIDDHPPMGLAESAELRKQLMISVAASTGAARQQALLRMSVADGLGLGDNCCAFTVNLPRARPVS